MRGTAMRLQRVLGWLIAATGMITVTVAGGAVGRLFGDFALGMEIMVGVDIACALYVFSLLPAHVRWSVGGQWQGEPSARFRVERLAHCGPGQPVMVGAGTGRILGPSSVGNWAALLRDSFRSSFGLAGAHRLSRPLAIAPERRNAPRIRWRRVTL